MYSSLESLNEETLIWLNLVNYSLINENLPTLKISCEAKSKIPIPVFTYVLGQVFNTSQLAPQKKLSVGTWKNFDRVLEVNSYFLSV